MQPEQLNEYINEYFVLTFMRIYGMIDTAKHDDYNRIVKELTRQDKKFKNVVNRVDEFINSQTGRFPPSIMIDALTRILISNGVDKEILDRAENTFNREELHQQESVNEAEEDWMVEWKKSKQNKNMDFLNAKENESISEYLNRVKNDYNKSIA